MTSSTGSASLPDPSLVGPVLFDDFLNSADLSRFKTDFDSVWMMRAVCQNILHNATCSFSSSLILLQDDVDL